MKSLVNECQMPRYLVKFIFATLVCLCQATLVSAGTESFEPNITAEIFDQDQVSHLGENGEYEFSNSGQIINGPRRAKSEPIDYTSLLSNKALTDVFLNSLFGCNDLYRHCGQQPFRWKTSELPLSGAYLKGTLTSEHFVSLNRILVGVLGVLDFSIPAVKNHDDAALIFYSGDTTYLLKKAKFVGDKFAVEFYSELLKIREEESWLDRLFDRNLLIRESCFLSTVDREEHGRVYMFFPPQELEQCLPRQLLAAVGLNETGGYFPSATGGDHRFRASPLADQLFFGALYDDEFPISGNRQEMVDFFQVYLKNSDL